MSAKQNNFYFPKTYLDPFLGVVDFHEFLPMVEVPEFQWLDNKYQLGANYKVFPSATHTRKQHSLGAFQRTRKRAIQWRERRFITEKEGDALSAYALFHDIGHGPFSHSLEFLSGNDHDKRGLEIISMPHVEKAVRQCLIDYDLFYEIFSHKNPLYLAVFDKNLGAEKLDYLERDAFYTISERPPIDYLFTHTYFIRKRLVIDERAINVAKSIQNFYSRLFRDVYLRRATAIIQRLIQKLGIRVVKEFELSKERFWQLTDSEFLGLCAMTKDPETLRLYNFFKNRILPKQIIVFRHKHFAGIERIGNKNMAVVSLSNKEIDLLRGSKYLNNPYLLEETEENIAGMLELPSNSVFIIPIYSPQRFEARDIDVLTSKGEFKKLSHYFPDHFAALDEEGLSYMALRVCVLPELRRALDSQKIKLTQEHLLSLK